MSPGASVPRSLKTSESDEQSLCKSWLQAKGCRCHRRNVAGPRKLSGGHYVSLGKKGQSDLWGALPDGRHFELEMKKRGERPTDDQIKWLLEWNDAEPWRCVAVWVDSLERLEAVFRCVTGGGYVVYEFGVRGGKPGDYRLESGCS